MIRDALIHSFVLYEQQNEEKMKFVWNSGQVTISENKTFFTPKQNVIDQIMPLFYTNFLPDFSHNLCS